MTDKPTRDLGRTPSTYALGAFLKLHQFVYEKTGGRIGKSMSGRDFLLLHTVGRKTGKHRVAALLYVRDGDNYVVIASTGGGPNHPGWYHNLRAQPGCEIQVGTERINVRARVAEDEERERLWQKADEVNKGGYSDYQSRTPRDIPVVVLEPQG